MLTANTEFVGMLLEDAQKLAKENGIPLRLVERDGKGYVLTCDAKPYRVNVKVNHLGVIFETYYG